MTWVFGFIECSLVAHFQVCRHHNGQGYLYSINGEEFLNRDGRKSILQHRLRYLVRYLVYWLCHQGAGGGRQFITHNSTEYQTFPCLYSVVN